MRGKVGNDPCVVPVQRMKIVKLTHSEKAQDSYYAEFEDGSTLAVSVAMIADFGLFTGRELDDGEVAGLRAAAASASSRARALRILGSRGMSRKQIEDSLIRKGESDRQAEETAEWLEKIGAVNDEELAALVVRHYARRGYGESRIRDELYRRGIPRELWEDAFTGMPDTEETVYSLLKSRLGGEKPDRAELKRASDALYRRGFSWDEIRTATQRYIHNSEDFSE